MSKFGTKVSHLWCDWHTSFKVKRSKVKVTMPINADTHCAPYVPNKAYGLQTWYMDEGRRPASATRAMASKVKVARSHDQSEPSWCNAVLVSLAAGKGIPCWPNRAATLLIFRCGKKNNTAFTTSCYLSSFAVFAASVFSVPTYFLFL